MSANPEKRVFIKAIKNHLKSQEIRAIIREDGPMNATKRMRLFTAMASIEATDVEKERRETEKAVQVAQKQAKLELLTLENKYLDLKIKVLCETGYDHKSSEPTDSEKSTTEISSVNTMDIFLMTPSSDGSQSSDDEDDGDVQDPGTGGTGDGDIGDPGTGEPAAKRKRQN